MCLTSRLFCFLALVLFASSVSALDCVPIPDSDVFAGDQFFYPYNTSQAVILPANFNCTYVIKAPTTSRGVIHGSVELTNQLAGVNDYIIVTDTLGAKTKLNSRSDGWMTYEVFPGRQMSIQVVTKSVQMNSKFLIHVSYEKVRVGPTTAMKTGGSLNYVDLSTLRGYTDQYFSSITVTGNEPISLSMAVSKIEFQYSYLFHCYVIDGDFYNQTSVRRLVDFVGEPPFVSKTNMVTIVSFQERYYDDTAAVLNPISEANAFNVLTSLASMNGELNRGGLSPLRGAEAVQILAVQNKQIIMSSLTFNSNITPSCVAKVVTGPPNNSSQLLLDLTTAHGLMPYTFKLKYFSIIAQGCSFSFTVMSPEQ